VQTKEFIKLMNFPEEINEDEEERPPESDERDQLDEQ